MHEQKKQGKGSGIHLRNFGNTVKQKTLRIPKQKEKEDSFILPASSCPSGQLCSVPRGKSQLEEFPSPGKREQGEQPASQAFQGAEGWTRFHFVLQEAEKAGMYRD